MEEALGEEGAEGLDLRWMSVILGRMDYRIGGA
jgi:hypothetical protein